MYLDINWNTEANIGLPDALHYARELGISLLGFCLPCAEQLEAPLNDSYRPGPGELLNVGRTLPLGTPKSYLYSLPVYIAYGGLRLWWCVV